MDTSGAQAVVENNDRKLKEEILHNKEEENEEKDDESHDEGRAGPIHFERTYRNGGTMKVHLAKGCVLKEN